MTSSRIRKSLYEGKAKILYEGPDKGTLIQYFKDDATAFNNEKKGTIMGKGVINSQISAYIYEKLNSIGIPTHFIKTLNMREQLVKEVEIVPLEIIIRNIAAGSFSKRYGIPEGTTLKHPVIEHCYKNDELGDPPVTEETALILGWTDIIELEEMRSLSLRINDYLTGLFAGIGITLVDFKLEFGRLIENDRCSIVLADEISPDSCRLWDSKTKEKLDKDRFRRDLGKIEEAYQEVARRLGLIDKNQERE